MRGSLSHDTNFNLGQLAAFAFAVVRRIGLPKEECLDRKAGDA
jgi:hypothetical protein